MTDIMFPAYQKYYSALSSLERFDKEADFFDNISALDSFFSEYRNITFVLQKSIAHTEYMPVYEKNREKYLSSCRWLVEKRNETTKEHPFQLVKQIDILVFFPSDATHVLTRTFAVENDVELSDLLDDLKRFFARLNPIQVFFSSKFSFYDKTTKEDVYEKIVEGIHSMSCFLEAMYQEIGERSKSTDAIIKKISGLKFLHIPRDMFLINDYAYYPKVNRFERAGRYAMMPKSDKSLDHIRMPLSNIDRYQLSLKMGPVRLDHFKKFVMMNVEIGSTDLMPTFMIVFNDDTFEFDSFQATLKTTMYRKVNEVAARIAKEDIVAVYYMATYTTFPMDPKYLQMTSEDRLGYGVEDVLTFMEVTDTLSERECYFERSKIQNERYIFDQLFNHTSSLNLGKTNMMPIVEAFRSKGSE